ncbi:hypothetical protein Tco_0535672 [Tanacetum coccineum]
MDPELVAWVLALEKRNAELEQVFMIQNKTTNNLASRIFTLEYRDLEYKIDNYVHLYEALKHSMARDNMDEFLAEKAKSRKRRRDDQDPPQPPPKESDQSKKKEHDTDTSALRQYPPQTSSAWKTTDTRDTSSSSSKQ